MVKYVCGNCNYNFESESANECRFCGMEEVEIEKSAGELIEDVERLFAR